ncbi:MAG: hypothetical protein H0T84_04490 [Tatlockia sp.]|nr:hypothetical protein [Tatlockia sp.]
MLSKINYYLDYLIKFLFINSKGNLFMHTEEAELFGRYSDVHFPKKIYDHQIRRYFGLGFLASFIPGTEAFSARMDYLSSLLESHKIIENRLSRYNDSFYYHLIKLTPLYFLKDFLKYYEIAHKSIKNINKIRKSNLSELLPELPIMSDILVKNDYRKGHSTRADWYIHLGHSLLNPFRMLSSLLLFLHNSVDAILESGESYTFSNPTVHLMVFKAMSAIIFVPLRLLVGVMEATVDLGLSILDSLFLDPIRFGYEVISQHLETKSMEYLYVPYEECDGIRKIEFWLRNPVPHTTATSLVAGTKNYILKIVTEEEKNKYVEDKRFYYQMKNRDEFATSTSFSKMSEEQKFQLSSFHSQLGQAPKLLQFGLFCQSAGEGMQDIYHHVAQSLLDLNKPKQPETKSNPTI